MQGRIENKIKVEQSIISKLPNYPSYVRKYYYSLNNHTHATKQTYMLNVFRFLAYMSADCNVSLDQLRNVDSYYIEQYISDMNYRQNKNGEIEELLPATKATIYSALCMFFDFLKRNDMIERSPFDNKRISRPKIQENEVVFLTPEEVKKVEQTILTGVGNPCAISRQKNWKYRDYLLFRLPIINGLRVTALSEINISDISLKNQTIKVVEKGNITKYVYFDSETKEIILKWIAERHKLMQKEENPTHALFISHNKDRMTTQAIADVIQKYTEVAVPGKHITPHKLRSTCGTNLYQASKDIYLVAEVLGHKSTAPTRRYAKVFDDDKRNAVNVMANLYK